MKRPTLKPGKPAEDNPRANGTRKTTASNKPPRERAKTAKSSPAANQASSPRTASPRPGAPSSGVGSTVLSRILTLAAVALIVFLVVFSPLRAWMDQQQQARELAAKIEQVKAQNAELEAEIKRYDDPEYISRQARERLGYVKPGEVTYVVVDPPGVEKPQLTDGWVDKDVNDLPWYRQIVAGLEVAGAAPAPTQPAAPAESTSPDPKAPAPNPADPAKSNTPAAPATN